MKIISIAIKDIKRSLRSKFALVFMFGVPLMVTGMFYLMFGNMNTQQDGGIDLPVTRVVLVNLDEGDEQAGQLGIMIADSLRGENFSSLMEVSTGSDPAAARALVDAQQVGVAVIIPPNFSKSFTQESAVAEIEVYQDPALSIGPGIVRSILKQYSDSFAGIKITVNQALKQVEAGQMDYSQIQVIVADYLAAEQIDSEPNALLDVSSPQAAQPENWLLSMIGSIMAGMMIFYAYYTGASCAESILREHEEGTLQRLFTTPTTQAEVLAGKFLAVGLTVLVQVVTLLIAARLIFKIQWGALSSAALASGAVILSATASGILLCSLLKNTRQGGIIFGGLLTVTGMVGMIDIFTGQASSGNYGFIPLLTPQGWAARGMLLSMQGAAVSEILPFALVLIALSILFFIAGVWKFQKRYA